MAQGAGRFSWVPDAHGGLALRRDIGSPAGALGPGNVSPAGRVLARQRGGTSQTFDAKEIATTLLSGANSELVRGCLAAGLAAGQGTVQELWLLDRLDAIESPALRAEAAALLVAEASNDGIAQKCAKLLRPAAGRSGKLRAIADDVAWGRDVAEKLTGRQIEISILGGAGLGYTQLEGTTIHVNPLPILRREKGGRDIFRGLILHELGHHKYHGGPKSARVWTKARTQGLGELLNLVADEHLERNLAAHSADFANYFRRLAAYAFQYSCREIATAELFRVAGGQAFRILTRCRLRPGRTAASVSVANGQLLRAMEQSGMSFSRFVRALRMGLGNRSGDPKVAEALKLFGPGFRHGTMTSLLAIAGELKRIFGSEVEMLGFAGQDRTFAADDRELLGQNITDADVERESARSGDASRPRRQKGLMPQASAVRRTGKRRVLTRSRRSSGWSIASCACGDGPPGFAARPPPAELPGGSRLTMRRSGYACADTAWTAAGWRAWWHAATTGC